MKRIAILLILLLILNCAGFQYGSGYNAPTPVYNWQTIEKEDFQSLTSSYQASLMKDAYDENSFWKLNQMLWWSSAEAVKKYNYLVQND